MANFQSSAFLKNIVDKRKEQTLRLLRRIVPAFTVSNFIVIGVFLLIFPDYAYVAAFLVPVLPISLFTFYYLQNGRIELASLFFIGGLWATVTIISWVLGMLSPSIYSYILIILLASLLLSRRVVLYATVASVASMTVIFIFQMVGWTIVPPMETLELVGAWLGGVINLMLVTGFVYAATSSNQKALVNEQMVIADLLDKEQNFVALLRETNQALLNEQREREEAESALLSAEERYKILFNTALVMYVITEHQQGEPIVVDCNEVWAETLGYELDEVIGRPIREFYAPESVEALNQNIQSRPRIIPTKEFQSIVEDKRYLLAKDGRLIPTLFRLLLVSDDDGTVIGSQALYVDMTMFEKAQEQAYLYANRVEVMYRASLELSRSLNVDEVFKKLLENLKILVPYDSAHVMLIDAYLTAIVENPQHYAEWTSPERGEIQLYQPNSNPILRRIYEEKETVIIDDTHEDPEWEVITGSEHIRNWMGVPLVVKDEIIGLYGVNKNEPHFFTREHAQLAESLASQAAVSISNATLYGQVQQYARDLEHRVEQRTADLTEANGRLQQEIVRRKETEKMLLIQTEQLAGLRHVGLQLAEQLDLNLLLSFVLEEAVKLLAGDAGHLVLIEKQNGQEVLNVAYAYGDTQIKAGDVIHHRMGVMGEVWESRKPFYQNHYKEWEGSPLKKPGYNSVLGAPIMWREQMVGVLTIMSKTENYFNHDSAELLMLFSTQAAVAIQNAQLHDTVQQNAAYLEEEVAKRTHELSEANKQLRELDNLRTKLIHDISHELRTPVTSLSLYLELLERNPHKRERYTKVLREQMDRLETLVEDIVQVSDLHTRQDRTVFTQVDINNLVKSVIQSYRVKAEQKSIEIRYLDNEELPDVIGDPHQLEEMFKILLVNAISYTNEGYICIKVRRDSETDHLIITLADTGIGIPEQDLNHIFEPLYRGKGVSQLNVPGMGLGLTTAQEIIRIHKGQIVVDSTVGKGSKFTIHLPVLQRPY